MRYYPLLLDISKMQVLIAGAGEVGLRKSRDIISAGASSVLLVDPVKKVADLPDDLLAEPALNFVQRPVAEHDLEGCNLVFACANSREANRALAQAAAKRGILCNVADAPEEGAFIVPAYFEDDDFILALSTSGSSPALAKVMRQELQDWYGGRHRLLLRLLKNVRPLILGLGAPTAQNSAIFRAIVHSGLGEALGKEDFALAKDILTELLPSELHGKIEELLHGLS